jgi:FkbM family methyltransferase
MLAEVNVPNLAPYKMRIFDDGCPHLSDQIRRDGIYERCETALTCQIVKQGDTVLDIGANIGYYTLLTSKIVGTNGQVYAFEPEFENFRILEWNVDNLDDKNTICVNAGISNYSGEANLYLCRDNPGGHHLHEPVDIEEIQMVQITSIDEYLQGRTEKVDYIKIDAQGAEQSILTGMKKTLEKNRDNLTLLMEFAPGALNASAGGLNLALESIKKHFSKFMFIDDKKLNVSEMAFEDIVSLGKMGLDSDEDLFANLLCFANPHAFEAVRRSLS